MQRSPRTPSYAQRQYSAVKKIFLLREFQTGVDSLASRHQAAWRFPLSARVAFLSMVLLTVPVLSQQSTMNQRVPGGNWSPTIVKPEPPRDLNPPALRLQEINQDAEEFSALTASLQSDLLQLRKGLLTKDLTQNLKKMEKLAKKLRQEVSQ
jgi:hypothetical protein